MSPVRPFLILVVLAVAIVGAATPVAAQGQMCTALEKVVSVHDAMTDGYLWYQNIPQVPLEQYATPEAYLEAVRYRPLDQTFSYITSREAHDAFYSESQFIGFGFSTSLSGNELRVTQVFPGSPAEEITLVRGARIREIGGRTVADLVRTGEIGGVFGASSLGVTTDLLFERNGVEIRRQMAKRLVTIPTVSDTRILTINGRKVGYIFFRTFVEPSYQALDHAFAEFAAAGVTELVLDLRYNGGGLINVAQHLASLIGGTRTQAHVFAEYVHNDRTSARNRVIRFTRAPHALTLDKVVVIATRGSASASELVINGLRPFMPVWIVGDRTYGKPVGQYGTPFCDKVLAAVAFTLRNADGQGDYFAGLQPDCPAADDVEHQLGDPAEESMREALTVITTGGCSAARVAGPASLRRAAPSAGETGWAALVGAH